MTSENPKAWGRFWQSGGTTPHHSALNITPFKALYGYPPPLHVPYFPCDSQVHYVDESLTATKEMLKVLRHHLRREQKGMKP